MSKLDILFVRPNSKRQNYGELDNFKLTAIEPPLWPAMLASYCREHGLDVDILDGEVEGHSPKIIANLIMDMNPKKVIINVCGHNPSASTQSMVGAKQLMEYLNQYISCSNNDIEHIIFHGLHPSALPKDALRIGADSVIVGEGFDVITKLMDTELPPIINSNSLIDLQTLPLPAWDLLPVDKYRAHAWHCFGNITERQGYGVVYTSLGCPNNCSFCVIHTMTNNQRKVRYRTPEQVLNGINFWVERGVTNIRLIDENFTINKPHTIAVCKAITARYGDALNIWAYASPITIDKPLLEVLRSAGIKWLGVGFESSQFTEKGQTGGWWEWEENIEILASEIQEAGIYINANWMFGLENETWGSMQNTLHLAQRINSEWANLYCVIPYPGSKLYTTALENGLPLPNTWEGYSQYSPETFPLPTKYLQSKDILSFRDYAFKTYYGNPKYHNMIFKKFGIPTVNHIREMLKIELHRNILKG
jgi:anaerobic magnesium-protoporphyrin IX monomethyl ester cyclase